jgi:hypothetical protein
MRGWEILGLVALGAVIISGTKTKKKKTADPVPLPTVGSCAVDAHMPMAEQQLTIELIANPTVTAEALEGAAQLAALHGYPLAAACLRAEAQLRAGVADVHGPAGLDLGKPETWIPAMTRAPGIDDFVNQAADYPGGYT